MSGWCWMTYAFHKITSAIHREVCLQIHRLFSIHQHYGDEFLNAQWTLVPFPIRTKCTINAFIVFGCFVTKQTKQWDVQQYDQQTNEKLCERNRITGYCLEIIKNQFQANDMMWWKYVTFDVTLTQLMPNKQVQYPIVHSPK